MTAPRVVEARPAGKSGVLCVGYRRRPHVEQTGVYRIAGMHTHLCWSCLLRWGADHQPMRCHRKRRRVRR